MGGFEMPSVTPQALTRTVQDFLSESAGAVVLENGAVAFDLAQSKYSISGEYRPCLLHLWSGRANPCAVCAGRSEEWHAAAGRAKAGHGTAFEAGDLPGTPIERSPSARRVARIAYEQKASEDAGTGTFPEFKVTRLTTASIWKNPLDRFMREV